MAHVRQAARVVLVDRDQRVLLLWHSRALDDDHWAPPGGGIEPGESPREAAAREVQEEVGLTGVQLQRPVWTWTHRFSRHGKPTDQHETLFVSRLQVSQPVGSPTHWGADGIAELRWWALPELACCQRDVWPPGLSSLLPAVLAGGLDPPRPVALGC